MRNKQGGTRKWCTKCKSVRVVKCEPSPVAIPAVSSVPFSDIKYFRRCQECQTCGHYWISAEVPEDLIYELMFLRAELRDIKETAEAHSEEPDYGSLRLL